MRVDQIKLKSGMFIVIAMGGLLIGCARSQLAPVIDVDGSTGQSASETTATNAPVAQPGGIVVQPLADDAVVSSALAPPEDTAAAGEQAAPVNPAMVALLNTATSRSHAGQHDAASASLERALQIEPQNAWVWHRLAKTRIAQGQPEEAASLAARSNTFASDDRRLLADNWRLIALTREQQGDVSGARAANLRAEEFVGSLN